MGRLRKVTKTCNLENQGSNMENNKSFEICEFLKSFETFSNNLLISNFSQIPSQDLHFSFYNRSNLENEGSNLEFEKSLKIIKNFSQIPNQNPYFPNQNGCKMENEGSNLEFEESLKINKLFEIV